jgi:hypothetical protein
VESLYLKRGNEHYLILGTAKSLAREIAAPSRAHLSCEMKTSESSTASDHTALAVLNRRSFPLGTLMVCFTIWLVATEALIFDQIKFNTRIELLEQATRAIRGSQLLVPTERPSNLPGAAKVEKL